MIYCQKESEDNYESKYLLNQKKSMLREILRLFPAGIIFYSDKKGILYENKSWIDMIGKFKALKFQFWKKEGDSSSPILKNTGKDINNFANNNKRPSDD